MNDVWQSPQVRVVQASAGSGKTYALANRYLQLLFKTSQNTPQALKHILAITFTNKAAGEMKMRIIAMLKQCALGQLPKRQEEELLKVLVMDQKQLSVQAAILVQDIIRFYHYFGVKTIDSFMNTLLSGCAFKIQLSARFKIKRNSFDYLELSLDELIDESYAQKPIRQLFNDFIKQYLFLENRSGWFPKKDLLRVLKTLFNQYNTYQKSFLTFENDGMDVFVCKTKFLDAIGQLRESLPSETDGRFVKALDNFMLAHPRGFDIDDVSDSFARLQVPLNKGGVITVELQEQWRLIQKLLRLICLQESYAVFNPYVRLFDGVMGHFNHLQIKDDILFLEQLNRKAAELFDEAHITVEELYYRLATRYHHYLIDEFQDTSLTQWQNLQVMVEEALATGGSLFYVGDQKQAIYSFRGGDSRLFNSLSQKYAQFNLTSQTLGTNYRSHREIVAFNNDVFDLEHLNYFLNSFQNEERCTSKDIVFNPDDRNYLKEVYGSARQVHRDDLPHGAVRIEIVSASLKNERMDMIRNKIIERVRDLQTRFANRDIAILTRNNSEVASVTSWLLQEGIPAQSERTSDIKEHPLIAEIISFLSFVHSPINDAAFADVLLGDVFVKASGIPKDELQQFLFRCHLEKQIKGATYFYKQFKDQYSQIWENFFEMFFSQSGVYPLYELTVGIYARLRCLELFPQAQAFWMHFLELIKRREEESCDLESFLEYFENLEQEERFVPNPNQDAVRILTIHKSKGLEFSAVIIPFLEMSIKVGSSEGNGAQSFTWNIEEEGLRLMRLKESYGRFSAELKERYAQEFKKSFFYELNSVYVALTRSIWELHIFIPDKVNNSVNPVLFLLPSKFPPKVDQPLANFCRGEYVHPLTAERSGMEYVFLPTTVREDWISHLQEEFESDQGSNDHTRIWSQQLHLCLAQIGNVYKKDISACVEAAVIQAQRICGATFLIDQMRKDLERLLTHSQWKPFFDLSSQVEILCEQEVVNHFGQIKRIDRLIVDKDTVNIVDFKTTRKHIEDHKNQMHEYEQLVSALYPKHTIVSQLLYVEDVL